MTITVVIADDQPVIATAVKPSTSSGGCAPMS